MDDTNQLIEQRLKNLAALREFGIDPFTNKFTPSEGCGTAKENYVEGRTVAVAGRLVSKREMGKTIFAHIRDVSGTIQLFIRKNDVGEEAFKIFKGLDLADFVGANGALFTTKTGEISVKMTDLVVLAKALRPPPDKWHGLADQETRYRQRYLDLIANDEVRDTFLKRSAIIREIRNFMDGRGFVEVETPMMQAIPGGAAARAFVTHHNTFNREFFLRIALELSLKKLLVGGIERVFEIGRIFRNEGISRRHNPEFTMLEAYQAYGDYETMMELLQSMICHVSEKVCGTLVIEQKDAEGNVTQTIDLTPDWRRAKYKDLIREKAGDDWFDLTPDQRRARATGELQIETDPDEQDFEVTNAVFEKLVEPTLIQPTFVTHLPKELVPLAKLSPDEPDCVEVFECCINGQEIALVKILLDTDEVSVHDIGRGAAVGGHLGGVVAQDAEIVGLNIDFDLDLGVEIHILVGEFAESGVVKPAHGGEDHPVFSRAGGGM